MRERIRKGTPTGIVIVDENHNPLYQNAFSSTARAKREAHEIAKRFKEARYIYFVLPIKTGKEEEK